MESKTLVTKLLDLARHDPKYLADLEQFRRAITVMFTDIQGSTAYFEKHGDAAGLLLLHECNSLIRTTVEEYGGRVIKTIGDGSMATFDDCVEAVRAAMAMQRALGEANALRRPEEQTAVRIGLHYGVGIVKSNDVFGDVVNMASRVESVALPRQIVISEQVREQIAGADLKSNELGRFVLKGKSGDQPLFEVPWKPAEAPVQSAPPNHSAASAPASEVRPLCKLQVIKPDGSVGAEYLLKTSLTIGRSGGDVRFPSDTNMSPLNARITFENTAFFVEDIGEGGGNVFLAVSGGYTLQDGDIVIMGNQAMRFHENSTIMSAATMVGATLQDLSQSMNESVAEFVQLGGSSTGNCLPLRSEEVLFGRTRGTYTFPEDKLLSRLHARVLQRGEDFIIEDAGSRNGTYVQVRRRALLPVGSAVLIGSRLLRLVEHA